MGIQDLGQQPVHREPPYAGVGEDGAGLLQELDAGHTSTINMSNSKPAHIGTLRGKRLNS